MTTTCAEQDADLIEQGHTWLTGVYSRDTMQQWQVMLDQLLPRAEATLQTSEGYVFAARNVLETYPAVRDLWRVPRLESFLRDELGPEAGLVRVLYFDKHPGRTWGVPWHQDRVICARAGDRDSQLFRHPTFKAGRPHVEAPVELLERMLTLRIHLDDVTSQNGPLQVMSGTHRFGKEAASGPVVSLCCEAGDVLAMRPLLYHASGHPGPGNTSHRRVLHLEFTGVRELADGFSWYEYYPLTSAGN